MSTHLAYSRELAQALIEDMPGIPDIKTALEILESVFHVMKHRLLGEDKAVYLEGIGHIFIKRYKGSIKRDPRDGHLYKMADRNILKFKSSPYIAKSLNIGRKKRERVD